MIDISYVITVYNKADHIAPMLNALERQEGDFSREFIFVDDGSTDHSLDIIRERTKDWPNVRILEQENAGVSVATNTGGFAAKGEFIKIVDADDAMTPYASRRLLDMMRAHNLDQIAAEWKLSPDIETDSKNALETDASLDILEDPLSEFFKVGMGGSTSTMIRTRAFKDVGGCDERVFVQDFSLPLRLSKKHRMACTDLLVVFGPENADGRILDAQATVIHDLSATMYYFLMDNPDISADLQRLAFKRCAGRAWKWAKRKQGKSIFSRAFYLYLLSRLPIWQQTSHLIGETMYIWKDETVRQSGSKKV
ncbi:glycosyltransferase [Terasakiella sp.]|uniref:glycosyltransferase n=1 Tax=Terasakiella sp. TaxID=2034861 RepID=UPI003AA7C1AF